MEINRLYRLVRIGAIADEPMALEFKGNWARAIVLGRRTIAIDMAIECDEFAVTVLQPKRLLRLLRVLKSQQRSIRVGMSSDRLRIDSEGFTATFKNAGDFDVEVPKGEAEARAIVPTRQFTRAVSAASRSIDSSHFIGGAEGVAFWLAKRSVEVAGIYSSFYCWSSISATVDRSDDVAFLLDKAFAKFASTLNRLGENLTLTAFDSGWVEIEVGGFKIHFPVAKRFASKHIKRAKRFKKDPWAWGSAIVRARDLDLRSLATRDYRWVEVRLDSGTLQVSSILGSLFIPTNESEESFSTCLDAYTLARAIAPFKNDSIRIIGGDRISIVGKHLWISMRPMNVPQPTRNNVVVHEWRHLGYAIAEPLPYVAQTSQDGVFETRYWRSVENWEVMREDGRTWKMQAGSPFRPQWQSSDRLTATFFPPRKLREKKSVAIAQSDAKTSNPPALAEGILDLDPREKRDHPWWAIAQVASIG